MRDPSPKPTGETTTEPAAEPVSSPDADPDATTAFPPADTDPTPSQIGDLDATLDAATTVQSFSSHTELAETRRGKYAVVNLHAQGGLGKVSVAIDERIGRRVALKEIRADRHSDEAEHRFLSEAEITGQLEHPGIVPVYAMDEDEEGRPFYVMRFIEGITLYRAITRHHADANAASFSELITRFLGICQALAYAHSRGIIHRDLKPANVMLGEYGETLVLDWGLAKRLQGPEDAAGNAAAPETISPASSSVSSSTPWSTMDGAVLGTPSYLAPEQARGDVSTMDERCDVFGLGGILCAIITGAPPFQGDSAQEMMRQAQLGDLSKTFERLDGARCDRELIDIAKHCLAPSPTDRPAHAGAVADAVSAYQASVQDRLRQAELDRVAAQTKAAEETKRRRVTVGLCVAVAAFLLAIGVVLANHRQQQRQFAADLESAWTSTDERILESYQNTLDPPQMRNTLEMGKAHLQLASDRLDGRGSVSLPLSERHDLIARQLRDAMSDLQILEAFDRFEENSTRVDVKNSKYDNVGAVDTLAADLKAYFNDASDVKCADLIRARPAVMQERLRDILYFGLSEAAIIRHTEPMTWFASVIKNIDQDPWREKAMKAMVASDRKTLDRLSDDASLQAHAPMFLASFAEWLPNQTPSRRENFLRDVQCKYPAYFWANHGLARLHVERLPEFHEPLPPERIDDAKEAVRFFTAATVARPNNAGICVNLGLILERLGRTDQAIAYYRRSTELRPDYFAGHENLGLALRNRGDLKEATGSFAEAARLNPTPYRWAKLGELLLAQQRNDEAIASYRKGIALAADDAISHFELASALERVDRLQEAAASFRRGLELDPENSSGLYNFGNLQSRLEDFAGAAVSFQRAIDLKPDDLNSWIGMALAQLRGGESVQGIEALQHATTLRPEEPLAWINLGYAYLSTVDHPRSEQAYRRAIAVDSKNARSMAMLGESLKRQGRLREAVAEYERAEATKVHAPNYTLPTQDWIRETQEIVELYARLPLTAKELETAANAGVEPLLLAAWQGFHDEEWDSAATLIRQVADRQPDLIGDHLTNVRAMAAQVLIVTSNDRDDVESAKDRQQALQWMTADLNAWTSADLAAEHAARRRETLLGWQRNPNFASVRDEPSLRKLDNKSQRDWGQFWQQVDDALTQ